MFPHFSTPQHHLNVIKVCVNFALFMSSLLSLCCGQVFAIPNPNSSNSARGEPSGDKAFPSAHFPSDVEADILLGGLFPVHNENITTNSHTCGSLNVERGIHRLEATIFAVNQINSDPDLLRNVTLGLLAYDTCGWYTRALEESLEFVRESLNAKNNPVSCPDVLSSPSKKDRLLAGVVGAAASAVSIPVANLLRLFYVPQISYASTTPDLSDKTKYDFFMRTVPPDNYQARAMVDVVRALKWASVFTVSSEGVYGERGIREFTTGAKAANVCIAGSFKVEDDEQINNMFSEFFKHPEVRGIVLFCTDTDAGRILKGAQRRNAAGRFIWVASDYWGTRKKPIDGLEKFAEGAISVSLTEANSSSFTDYFTSLKPGNHSMVNPWFDEFWETHFHCSLKLNPSSCSKSLSLKNASMRVDDKVPFVIDAVYAFAHALNRIYKSLCPAQEGLCPEMVDNFDRKRLRDVLFNVSFTGITGPVTFDRNGNGPGRYDIYRLEGGEYQKVASWDDGLYNETKLYRGSKNGTIPLSRCGAPCLAGYYKLYDFEGSCCWTCKECPENYYVKDETSCKSCKQGERPNTERNGCESLPRRHVAKSWFVMVMVFAGLGILCTIFVSTLFLINNDTPLVKASGRELTCALLFGLLSCYVFSFFLLAEPSVTICAIQRFGLGFSFCLCYAAILIRTNRIARIFEKSGRSTKPPILIKPASQIAILAVFVSIDVAFASIGLAKWPPETVLAYPTNKDVLLICNIQNYDLIFALTYNALIIFLCTFYAFRTRKTPENFNEARYIGFAMYTTCIIWVAFLPVQFGVNKDYATITISINTTLNATTLLLCIFGPKVYILVFRPTRNLRGKSLNSWRSEDTPDHSKDRTHSESQIPEVSVQGIDLGIDNAALENGHKQSEASL